MRVRVQIQMSVINSYHGVGIVIGNCTSIMMTRLGVTMTRFGMIMVRLFATLQRGLEITLPASVIPIHTTESVSRARTARASMGAAT